MGKTSPRGMNLARPSISAVAVLLALSCGEGDDDGGSTAGSTATSSDAGTGSTSTPTSGPATGGATGGQTGSGSSGASGGGTGDTAGTAPADCTDDMSSCAAGTTCVCFDKTGDGTMVFCSCAQDCDVAADCPADLPNCGCSETDTKVQGCRQPGLPLSH